MVDKILNNNINTDIRGPKNSYNAPAKSTETDRTPNPASGSADLVSIKADKNIVSDLASSAPIDADKVASIKAAISSGNYPLDMDKISDALMQAYREMKS